MVMSSKAILVLVLSLATCPVYECRMLKVAPKDGGAATPILSPVTGEPLTPVTAATPNLVAQKKDDPHEDGEKKPETRKERVKKHVRETATKIKKKIMHPIDVMRGELCLTRHDMMGHTGCMEWLVNKCTTTHSGTGLCTRTRAIVKEECLGGREIACEWAKKLGMDIKHPEKEEEKEAEAVEEAPTHEVVAGPAAAAPAAAAPAAAAPAAAAPAAAEKKEEPKKEEPKKEEPKKEEPKKEEPKKEGEKKAEEPTVYKDPDAKAGLAEQGFSGKPVLHPDGETHTGDWLTEYGHDVGKKHSGAESWRMQPLMYVVIVALAMFN